MHFRSDKMIRFHHCDPAGIVFFPQYMVLCHEIIEDWIEHGLGVGFGNLLKVRRLGMPTVSLKCEFLARSSFGESLSFDLSLRRLGTSSMTISIVAHGNSENRLAAELVVVMVNLETFKSVPIPRDLREKMTEYVAVGSSPSAPAP